MSGSLFHLVKPTCVALLGSATLTPSSVPSCIKHLDDLVRILRAHSSELPQLSPSLVSYIFFPLSSILQRNDPPTIPDQILEKVLILLGFLSESWWWHCEVAIWEQIFMLCGSVLSDGATAGRKSPRDDQVKQAAAQCLYTLLRQREASELLSPNNFQQAKARSAEFQRLARLPRFIPILGRTLGAVVESSESRTFSLQQTSLNVVQLLLGSYAPDQVFPMILPGVISSMSKVALATKLDKQWANGDSVVSALHVMQIAIVRSVGDTICLAEGALRSADNLEDLTEIVAPSVDEPLEADVTSSPTRRTPSWLKGTVSQLHIAINNLNVLTVHPNPVVLRALASFSGHVLKETTLTLPQTQPLLLAFLLSASMSPFQSVSSEAHSHLSVLLPIGHKSRVSFLRILLRNMSEYLSALPRLVSVQEESKVQHLASLIEAICRLASPSKDSVSTAAPAISQGIGKLLGPSGEVEKWGWNLLSVFEFSEVAVAVQMTPERLMLEGNPNTSQLPVFPTMQLRTMGITTLEAVERMFRALGDAGGDACLYAVEWFIGIGKGGTGRDAVAAMWCACRLLEGVSNIHLSVEESYDHITPRSTKRLEKLARSLAKTLPELWDLQAGDTDQYPQPNNTSQDLGEASLVERKIGLKQLHANLKIIRSSPAVIVDTYDQPINHRALTLQIISVCVGILQSRSTLLLIHVLYPVLHSLVSQVSFLASTAYASLQFMTAAASYASPANLLLSNFDYALDAISRRLTRRRLDVVATQVLVLLVRLVGSDVVEKAGDVVEECFDRLDEFHGYDVVVEGLVNVLVEVTKCLRNEAPQNAKPVKEPRYTPYARVSDITGFFQWYRQRHDLKAEEEDVNYGPAPRRAWGEDKEKSTEEEEDAAIRKTENPSDEPPPTPTQALTKQIVSRSLYFLTHGSPIIRARILKLLAFSIPNIPSSALMPAIHSAWPFILNRLSDQETFVVSATAFLIEMLSTHMGEYMFRRIWDDVWPKFKTLLAELQAGDQNNALVQRGRDFVGAESAYTHSHRLYRALLDTMTAALQDVHLHERSFWDVLVLFRRFLSSAAHPELQQCARRLYSAAMTQDADTVWLVLSATFTHDHTVLAFLYNTKWDIIGNAQIVLGISPTD
ncbi:hypothetical protein AGABI1DRAFT_117556 [Agaricus bisporus var. burnettii JB137-S8]|uniref:Pre-rRNA-processing protein RIX1 n=1 Tax=Agaricus bisporus var. burnettii (strain JB137-S8 / ATCC MYA-4627 / FGSC 10392) TaxID=597362 RepID=K5XL45_AGABU|nr:uncharacterized protein AGABI1DRAFT_117556 [Agaricus bisporus var. burnettii JB137-S8]EKM84112.1 hypothetical protein AGABI1DRAFT_117556 [Agaricus bisporus var. burnettii JB137-S8]